jgi:hypothetical protein
MIVGGNPSNPVIGHTQLPRGGHGIDVSADATEYKVYWRVGRDPLSQCARRVDRPTRLRTATAMAYRWPTVPAMRWS